MFGLNASSDKRILHHVAGIILAVAVVPGHAQAATFRVELDTVVNDAYPEAKFLRGDFDIGTRLVAIESVAVEFLMPSGISGGVCTGGGCSTSALHLSVHDISETFDLSLAAHDGAPRSDGEISFNFLPIELITQSDQLVRSMTYLLPNRSRSIQFQTEGFPEFLFSGKGAVSFQLASSFSSSILNGSQGFSSVTHSKPREIASAVIVIDGVPIPEPSSLTLILPALLSSFANGRQRRSKRPNV